MRSAAMAAIPSGAAGSEPLDEDPDENTMTIMSDCGIAEFELEDAGIRINRMITFVGGATAENFLHQLRILYITACQTQGGFDDDEDSEY